MALTGSEEALVRELIAQNAALLSLADNEAVITSKLGAAISELSDLSPAVSVSGTDLMLVRQGTTDKSITPAVLLEPFFGLEVDDIAVPSGGIIMWSGSVASIPANWFLCDGTNGTPNLQDKFVIGAGGTYAVGATGGAATHSHTVTVNGHVLSVAELPSHNHAMFANVVNDTALSGATSVAVRTSSSPGESEYSMTTGGGTTPTLGVTGSAGSGNAHAHGASSGSASNMPPYYALAYIMKA